MDGARFGNIKEYPPLRQLSLRTIRLIRRQVAMNERLFYCLLGSETVSRSVDPPISFQGRVEIESMSYSLVRRNFGCKVDERRCRRCRRRRGGTLIRLEWRKRRRGRWWSLRTAYFRRGPCANPAFVAPALRKSRRMDREKTKSQQNEVDENGLPFRSSHELLLLSAVNVGRIIPECVGTAVILPGSSLRRGE